MARVTITVTADIDSTELDKINAARRALGQQTRTPDDVMRQAICDALTSSSLVQDILTDPPRPLTPFERSFTL